MRVSGAVDIGEKCATGVAKLPGSIYILCKNPSSIVIHRDESPFDCTGEVSLKDLEAPHDMASSVKSSCLYVTDCTSNLVYKMTSPSHEVSPWLYDIGYPHTLTVTSPDDQVLILKYGKPSTLEVYRSSEDDKPMKVRSIQLPDEIEYPKHAVRSSGGNYAVSGKVKGSEVWGVFDVNVDGEMLHRLTQDTQLTEPYHLAIDSADRLIVADCWNHRLLVVDAKFSRSEELLPKDKKELRWPWRLHYVASDNQVLVLQHNGNVGRHVADGEKDSTEGKTKKDGIADEEKTAKDEEKQKATAGEGDTPSEEEKEKATTEEKKADKEDDKENAIANGKNTEKAEGEDTRSGEEEEKKGEEKGKQEKRIDTGHAVVYIYSYI